jgi:hypothetical protein
MAKVHQFMTYLIDQIRAVDPTRTIIYPIVKYLGFYGYGYPMNYTQFYNDLQTYGIPAKGNIVYDVLHPYYSEYPSWDPVPNSPTGSADWLGTNELIPAANVFGASNIWIGETFPWSPSEASESGNPYTTAQITFETEFINVCITNRVGLQLWCYFSRQSFFNYDWYDQALASSHW